jgi:soluble lytic murein transglycosylase
MFILQCRRVSHLHSPLLRGPGAAGCILALLVALLMVPAQAQTPARKTAAPANGADELLLQARDALRTKDKARLASNRAALANAGHPLALWADYWDLSSRLDLAQQAELDAFYARWPGTYVEDRLRNDWLLELGRRRDWALFRTEFPRFRMNDDREVTCFWLLTQHLDGVDVRAAALPAWHAQRDADDGCPLLGKTLVEARVFKADDAWHTARVATEANRLRSARATAALAAQAGLRAEATPAVVQATGTAASEAVAELFRDPGRFLNRKTSLGLQRELALLAVMRLAAADPDAAAAQLDTSWQAQLTPTQAALGWAHTAKQGAMKQSPLATAWAERAWKLRAQSQRTGHDPSWSDDLLAWHVRAALRLPASDANRWPLVARAIGAMSPAEQRDPAWTYWQARATEALAARGEAGDAARAQARQSLQALSLQTGFYPKLATEELGQRVALPQPPSPLSAAEQQAARSHPGLQRGLQLIAIGLRSEGVREWNFSLRGMSERELLAAAQTACEREVWDRCINTSERTRSEVDIAQRFPTPHRDAVRAKAREVGVDQAFIYGLIRQESRFIMDARSHVGASGLMQLMPATARWTAKKIGLPFTPELITDRDANLRLGATYLKLVLDDFGGSQALAAAAYNAGPSRPRRWREGPPVEPAAWAESIPFSETRDYVKKVLSNAVDYALVLNAPGAPGLAPTPPTTATTPAAPSAPPTPSAASIRARLGPPIGPREAGAAAPDPQLP